MPYALCPMPSRTSSFAPKAIDRIRTPQQYLEMIRFARLSGESCRLLIRFGLHPLASEKIKLLYTQKWQRVRDPHQGKIANL